MDTDMTVLEAFRFLSGECDAIRAANDELRKEALALVAECDAAKADLDAQELLARGLLQNAAASGEVGADGAALLIGLADLSEFFAALRGGPPPVPVPGGGGGGGAPPLGVG